ncbi:MAG: S-layer homology domain-containing protein [Oscillospiraceae bacterium]|nr:S-layer homology domain-containing protein [Oscillospiraceae bacterium]
MKKYLLIALTLVLCLSLCIGGVAHGQEADGTEDPTTQTPEEPTTQAPEGDTEIETPTEPEYDFPDDWSRPALEFAVEKGILQGNGAGDLRPHDSITRAETAAVLVRLLGAKGKGELQNFRDVDPQAWYYSELSAAVAAGIFNGTGASTMEPSAPITREQMMVVLCRAFGIVSRDPVAYEEFSDSIQISAYARAGVGALREKGLLTGYTDGSLKPRNPITRAETAQLLRNIFDCIADTPEEIPTEGRVLYRGTELLPEELQLEGSLVLAYNTPTEQKFGNWQIRDTLVLRMESGAAPELEGLQCAQLVLCTEGTFQVQTEEIWLGGKGVELLGDGPFLGCMIGDHSAVGNYATVRICGGSLDIRGTVQSATLPGSGQLSLRGDCTELYIGSHGKVQLQGDCETAYIEPYGELELTGNIDSLTMDGYTVLTLHGTAQSIDVTGGNATIQGSGQAESVVLHESGTKVSVQVTTLRDLPYENGYLKDYNTALSTVRTHQVPCTMNSSASMYRNQELSGYMVTVPKGARVYLEWNPSGSGIRVSYTDSDSNTWTGWVPRGAVSIHSSQAIYNGSLDYSQGTKEGFVNLRGDSSDTEYLIWVSRYTQKVMVYQGSQGNWKLIKTMPCATGANYCPTPQGVYTLQGHRTIWDFGDYVVYNVTVYNGPFAFHTVLYYPSGKLMDGTVGQPKSQGCVRMLKEDSSYIYNLPLGTKVVIY